jgi:hypothetical protein
MEVYEDVEENNKALKQDESSEFTRRKTIYAIGPFQQPSNETQAIYAGNGEVEVC